MISSTGWPVLVGRLLLLSLAASFTIMGFRVAWGGGEQSLLVEQYACPMHPEVSSDQPAECSICKMALEKAGEESHPQAEYSCSMHPDVTSSEPGRCSICKMDLTLAAKTMKSQAPKGGAYACPMHPQETSDAPGSCSTCKMDLVAQQTSQAAFACPMHPDETSDEPGSCSICKMDLEPQASAHRAAPASDHMHRGVFGCPMHPEETSDEPGSCSVCKMDLALETPGRTFACPMHTKETSDGPSDCPICGMASKKVADLRLPTLVSPSVPGFESAPWNWEAFPTRSVPITDGKPRISKPTKRVYVEDVRASAWCDELDRVFAVIYEDELVGLRPGDSGVFYRFKSPKTPIPVTLSDLEPRKWDHVTFSLAFHVDEPMDKGRGHLGRSAAELDVGDMGWVEMPNRTRTLLSIPEDALLMSGRERYVVLASADGSFLRRQVHVGTFANGYAAVLEGLTEHDLIVVDNAFFPDVERSERPTRGEDNQQEDAFFTGDRRSTIGAH